MSGILDRFTDIIKANINDLLDKAEDPAKMIDQYMRDMTESLAEVKQEAAGVIAEETRTKRLVDENNSQIEKYETLAKKALGAGNEDDARTFLTKKQEYAAKSESLETTYEAAHANADKMRQMHDKLVSDIETLKGRSESIKAKVAVAKTQEKVTELSGSDTAAEAMNNFERMEAKADAMLDKSNALTELDSAPTDPTSELEAKYDSVTGDAAVDDELAKLKADMGIQ